MSSSSIETKYQAEHKELLELRSRVIEQDAKIQFLTRQLFGRKSEKMVDKNQLSIFQDQLDEASESTAEDDVTSPTPVTVVKEHKRKRKNTKEKISPDVLTVKDVLDLSDEEKQCPDGFKLKLMGEKYIRTTVEYTPAKLIKYLHYVKSYKLVAESDDQEDQFVQAKLPNAVIPRSIASASILSKVLYDKYIQGVPLYRQLSEWKRLGLDLSETTLTNWAMSAAETLIPLYNLFHVLLVNQDFLQGDETTTEVRSDNNSKSYMWVARTVRSSETPLVYYRYNRSRSEQVASDLYKGFTGVLQCDGYSGYNTLVNVTRVGCFAHVRRKFYEEAKQNNNLTHSKPLELLNQMFALEDEWRDLTPDERYKVRQGELAELLNQFWNWIDNSDALPKSLLGKAVTYANKQRSFLNNILQYGEIDLSNNASERNMKSYVMARKNFLFSTSSTGAQTNAIVMTIFETAKANGIDPYEYMEMLLEKLPQLPEFVDVEQLAAYLPWNYEEKTV